VAGRAPVPPTPPSPKPISSVPDGNRTVLQLHSSFVFAKNYFPKRILASPPEDTPPSTVPHEFDFSLKHGVRSGGPTFRRFRAGQFRCVRPAIARPLLSPSCLRTRCYSLPRPPPAPDSRFRETGINWWMVFFLFFLFERPLTALRDCPLVACFRSL